MLFGLSLIFGLTGTASIPDIGPKLAEVVAEPNSRLAVVVATVFVLTGLGYKIASVPFHMWGPDVYEGAPIPVTAFLSVASKAAGFALLIRIFYLGFGQITDLDTTNWTSLLAVVSALTMTFGNLAALPQNNVKRLLAYSSIAHGGYLLMGVVLLNDTGIKAILFYLTIYLFMNMGAFFVVILVSNRLGGEMIQSYRNLISRAPLLAVSMAIFLFSLTGLPPLAGFSGKWVLFTAALEGKLYWLVIVAALNSAISLYYYIRIVKAMFFEQTDNETVLTLTFGNQILLLFFVVPTVLLFVFWEPSYGIIETVIKDFTPIYTGKITATISQ
jgi:NADH-quinone oxidoreductase subunit N